jgi:hypothetical protein
MTNKNPQQNESVAYRVLDESAVLVSPLDSSLYWLNPVASRIWELADGTRNTEAIAEALCEEFEVDPATALRDTEGMVAEFVEKNLLTA